MTAAADRDRASTAPTTQHSGTSSGPEDVASLGYEQARDELVRIVATLEGGRVGLEESMTLWQRGEALATRCTEWLDAAEAALPRADPSKTVSP